MRRGIAAWVTLVFAAAAVLAALSFGMGVGHASQRDETILTVQVGSADHELQEGYFTLGADATLMVKPGTDLYKFLSRQRGRTIKITLTDTTTPALSTLERE